MGWYWGATDLTGYLPQPVLGVPLIHPTSNPLTTTEFGVIVEMVEGEFHAAVAEAGYGFPIPTGASVAFGYAKKVVSDGAQAYALSRIGGQDKTAREMKQAYDDALKAIREGRVTLLDATAVEPSEGGRQLPRGGGIASPWVSATWMP